MKSLDSFVQHIITMTKTGVPDNFTDDGEKEIKVYSPVDGQIIPLSHVSDPTFRDNILGKGIAVLPKRGYVYSPVNGTIESVFSTQHAICLSSFSGVDIMIHAGIDTVMLNGKYHKTMVEKGSRVKIGDPIMKFDIENIQKAGYDPTVMVIVTNSNEFADVVPVMQEKTKAKEVLLSVYKK